MDRLKMLEIFKAVAERASFAKASEAMSLSTSVVTRAIKLLEDEVGVRLLRRTTRHVSLTNEGQEMLGRADALLGAYYELVAFGRDNASELAGDIKVTAPISFGTRYLSPALTSFMVEHPRVRLDVHLSDAAMDLEAGNFDLAVRLEWDLEASLIARRVGEMQVGLFASPAYLKHHAAPAEPQDLGEHKCLTFSSSGKPRQWSMEHTASGEHLELSERGAFSSNNGEALVAAAVHGAGLAVLPWVMADAAVSRGELELVMPDWRVRPLGVYLAYSSRRLQPARVRKLKDYLGEVLTGALSARRSVTEFSAAKSAKSLLQRSPVGISYRPMLLGSA